MDKKKLFFYITQLYNGGAERATVNLLKKLDASKYDVDILILNQIPLAKAVSLIPEIPSWVNVCDVYTESQKLSFVEQKKAQLLYKPQEFQNYPYVALEFVRNKEYDWAFHVGEWGDPAFVALEVFAKSKALWIHTDLSLAGYFDPDTYFRYLEQFDKCLFVSRISMDKSCEKYSYIKDKATVVYNIIDKDTILEKANKPVEMEAKCNRPVVLTVANIRTEKNHLRQLEAMRILDEEGFDFEWWNLGSLAYQALTSQVKDRIEAYGLQDKFILLGASDNPYPYMNKVTAVSCLSDFESWSMVISEAKTVGVPVIATKTAGAIEQIEDGKTGILTEFTAEDIASKLRMLLSDVQMQRQIRKNLKGFDLQTEAMRQFENLVCAEQKPSAESDGILLVIDNIMYNGGAHGATKNQIKMLFESGINDISIFSLCRPSAKLRDELPGVKFYSWESIPENNMYNKRYINCLTNIRYDEKEKQAKKKMSKFSRKNPDVNAFDKFVLPAISNFFSKYRTVCVISEGSVLKEQVSKCKAPNRIQWIHTDYCAWSESSDWARNLASKDRQLWEGFTKIVVLSEKFKAQLSGRYPEHAEKICVIPNIMYGEKIIEKSKEVIPEKHFTKFVTVARFEPVKALPRILNVQASLVDAGFDFEWVFVGDGEELAVCKEMAEKLKLKKYVKFVGKQSNPYCYMNDADVFVLPSYYEGLPNTIFEALILGIPVCATDVGGISDQVIPGENGWLAVNSEEGLYNTLANIMCSPDDVKKYKNNLKSYKYDNNVIAKKLVSLFSA